MGNRSGELLERFFLHFFQNFLKLFLIKVFRSLQFFSLKSFSENFLSKKILYNLILAKKLFNLWKKKSLFQTFSSKVSDLFYFFLEIFLSKQNIVPIRVFRPAVGNRPYARLLPGARKLDEPILDRLIKPKHIGHGSQDE